MPLMIGIYNKHPSQGGKLLLDATPYIDGEPSITTDLHGFAAFSASVTRRLTEAMRFYNVSGALHIGVYDGPALVWEGRIEDSGIFSSQDGSGNDLAAYGYSRAMADLPYTELWSTTALPDFRPLLEAELSNRTPWKFNLTSDESRIFIAPKKGITYTSALGTADMIVTTPSGSARFFQTVTFDYAVLLPAAFTARVVTYAAGFTSGTGEWSTVGTGALVTGSASLTLAASKVILGFGVITASTNTYANEDGDFYFRVTNVRIKTTTSASLYADEIAKALVGIVAAANPGQLATSTALIQSPGLDLRSVLYEDMVPGDILSELASRGDNQSPPRLWEWGVWEDQRLHFRPRGSAGRVWYVDASELQATRSLASMTNSAYSKYQDADGNTVRGAISTDAASVARYGVTRRQSVSADTTNATEANAQRDAFLNDRKDPLPSAGIIFSAVYDAYGGRWPLWRVRSGDQIVIRNLPVGNALLDRVRQFRISTTSYNIRSGTLSVEPEAPPATLETMLAREEIGY